MKNNIDKYADIINLPHHVSKKHLQMSLEARAAQFAPFAALTGYEESLNDVDIKVNGIAEYAKEFEI